MGVAKYKRPLLARSFQSLDTPGYTGDGSALTGVPASALSNVGSSQLDPSALQTTTVSLSAAQIIAMGTTAVAILAAPGAGKVILVDSILFKITRTGTAFTGGGAINFQYHTTTGSVPHAGTIAASLVTTGGAGSAQTLLGPNGDAGGLVIPANEGIDITNATAAFAAGTGTAKVFVRYRVVTL